ncbi:MAG: NosD domain-containing protein [Armatimonadota bacterium]|nr:NosD domain-containing protein [Armatimonadota bacterium]
MNKKIICRILGFLAVVGATLILNQACHAQQLLNVLFVGNSHTYYSDMPGQFRSITESDGQPTPNVSGSTFGGYTLSDHLNDSRTLSAIDDGWGASHIPWDFVVIQEHSAYPDMAEYDEYYRNEFQSAALGLYDRIKVHNPNAIVVIFETAAWNQTMWDDTYPPTSMGPESTQMITNVRKWCNNTAYTYIPENSVSVRKSDAIVSPVGDAWERNYNDPRGIMLHDAVDLFHPNPAGTYLGALVMYATMYNTAIGRISYTMGFDKATSDYLQEIARGGPIPVAHIKVKLDSPFNGPGNDWEHAWHRISDAVNIAYELDEVWVAKGVYNEKLSMKIGVAVKGGYSGVGDERNIAIYPTVINAGGTGYVVNGQNDALLDGFTLTGGTHGVYCYYASPSILNCTISDNTQYGVYCNNSSAEIKNNLIVRDVIGVHYTSGSPSIINNTIIANSSRGVSCAGGVSPTIANNILAYNGYGLHRFIGTPIISHNNVYSNTTGNYYPTTLSHPTDISADPLFADSLNNIYRLLPASPCVDAGDPTGAPSADMDGNLRPFDGNKNGTAIVDIGCYELYRIQTSSAGAKALPTGAYVEIDDYISTAEFSDRFYIQNPNKPWGIGVLGAISDPGKFVTVEGTMTTVDGEKMILASSITEGDTTNTPSPPCINFNALGGGTCGLQQGVKDYRKVKIDGVWQRSTDPISYGGANNIGLLVKVLGRVANPGAGFFYFDGACPFDDGDAAVKGVKVDWPYVEAMPSDGSFIEMTAISSCTIKGGTVVRLLRPVSVRVFWSVWTIPGQ